MLNQKLHTGGIPALLLALLLCTADQALAVPPLRLKPNNLADGTQYEVYSQTLTGSNGVTPYSWSLTGSLPPGLTLTPEPPPSINAVISGIPTQAGSFSFSVTLTDSSGPPPAGDIKNYSISVAPGNSCSFVGSNTGSVSFSAMDPSTSPGPIFGTVTQQVSFTCSAGLSYTVTANPASGWTINSASNGISYTLGFIAGGTGSGATPINLLTTNSSVLQADYMNAPGGTYTNIQPVTLSISWTAGGGGSITATIPAGGVSGMVMDICAVTQPAGTLTFAMDPSAPAAAAALSPAGQDLKIKCTKNSPVTIGSSSTCSGLAQNGSATCGGFVIPYTFSHATSVTGLGFGPGLDISLGIGGSAVQSNYANAPGGAGYQDVQTVTITY